MKNKLDKIDADCMSRILVNLKIATETIQDKTEKRIPLNGKECQLFSSYETFQYTNNTFPIYKSNMNTSSYIK